MNAPVDDTISPLIQKASDRDDNLIRRALIHNRPSDDSPPSRADIDMTQRVIEMAEPLGTAVHDHVIIGKAMPA